MSAPNIISLNLKDEARNKAKAVLAENQAFLSLPLSEQKDIYLSLVEENMKKLAKQHGLVSPMAKEGAGANMGFKDYDPGFENSVDAFEDLVDSVDFPKFVADLMKGVFDANLTVMKTQTDSYIKLMKEATKSVADFVKKVNDDDALVRLAETKPDMYNITMEEGPDGKKMTLTTPEGEPMEMDDNEVKAKIMEAKIQMAKEHRAALREVLLMGVTRLVVEKGEIEAGVEFKITANRASNKANQNTNTNVINKTLDYGGGLGSLFGGPRGSMNISNTNINISTSNKDAKDELFAKLMGKVNIKFKTDYFKLDNFAAMYGDGGVAALKPANQQGAAAPPATPPVR
jgi:hypothetical protein